MGQMTKAERASSVVYSSPDFRAKQPLKNYRKNKEQCSNYLLNHIGKWHKPNTGFTVLCLL